MTEDLSTFDISGFQSRMHATISNGHFLGKSKLAEGNKNVERLTDCYTQHKIGHFILEMFFLENLLVHY